MPRVTTSAGTPPKLTRAPDTSPQTTPMAMPRSITVRTPWSVPATNLPQAKAERPTTDPTERSMFRVITTADWPTASSTRIEALSSRSLMPWSDRKSGLAR